ncbi:hypothetical protein TWF506_008685 [Arthrobotrys conoides]|uniref:Uncharacterized protein n=1 Tax=Arthrobotrys conoides TaxID=74498 RepID=A0AAN8NDP8_9PEZI
MSEGSEDSPPPGFTLDDFVAKALKEPPYLFDKLKDDPVKKKPIGNTHQRFPETLRDQFRDQYRDGFHSNFQQQAEMQFEEAFPQKGKTVTPEEESSSQDETSSVASYPSIQTIPDPVSYTPSPERTPSPAMAPIPVIVTDPVIPASPRRGTFLTRSRNPVEDQLPTVPRRDPWIGGELPQPEPGVVETRRDGEFPESLWQRFDEFHAGGHFVPLPTPQTPAWSQEIADQVFQDYIARCEEFPAQIIMDMGIYDEYNQTCPSDEGYAGLHDLSSREVDSHNEEAYQDAREFQDLFPELGIAEEPLIYTTIDPRKLSKKRAAIIVSSSDEEEDEINEVNQTTIGNSEADKVFDRAIDMFLEQEQDFMSGSPRIPFTPGFGPSANRNLTMEKNSGTDVEIMSPETSGSEVRYPDQDAASVIFNEIYKTCAKAARKDPDNVVHPSEYLTNIVRPLRQPTANLSLIETSGNEADDEASDSDEAHDPSPPVRKIVTLRFNPEKLRSDPKQSKVTFNRVIEYRKEIRKMQRDGRFKDYDEVRLIKMEIKFTELQELVDGISQKMKATLVLHEDLFYGVVGFSRWSVEGRCHDVEIFDMLMAFNRIIRHCDNDEDDVTLLDIVEEYTTPEKRIDCHEFSADVFKLPIRFLTAAEIKVENSYRPSSPEPSDNEDVNNKGKGKAVSGSVQPKTAAMSFMGKVAVRFNRSNGEFCFSGLYHLVRFGGRPRGDIDFHKHQKDGSPFAPGSGGTGSNSRYQRYGGSSIPHP